METAAMLTSGPNLTLNTTLSSSTGGFQASPLTGLIVHLVIVLLLSGNLLIVITLALYKPWSIADLLLFSLSLADLLNAAIPLQILNIMNNFVGPDSWNQAMCDTFVGLTYLLRMASVCTITLISAERTMMLTRPLTHHTTVTIGKAKKAVLGTWLFSLLVAILPFIGVGESGFRDGYCFYQLLDFGAVYGYIVEFIGIVQLVLVLACFIALKVSSGRFIKRQNTMSAASQIGAKTQKKARESAGASQVKRLSTMMAIVVILYYISWLPYLLSNLVGMVTGKMAHAVALIVGMFSLVNALINPVLYGRMSQRYRRGYIFITRKVLSLCGRARPDGAFFDGTRRRSIHMTTNSQMKSRANTTKETRPSVRQHSQVQFAVGGVGTERSDIHHDIEGRGGKEENGNILPPNNQEETDFARDSTSIRGVDNLNDKQVKEKNELGTNGQSERQISDGIESQDHTLLHEEDDEALLDSAL